MLSIAQLKLGPSDHASRTNPVFILAVGHQIFFSSYFFPLAEQDACGGMEKLDMEKQQVTAEKQELESKVSHPSEAVHLRLSHGLMSWG